MTAGLSGLNNTHSQNSFLPRAWASSTPPTCAVLDGRAPDSKQMGQPGRLLSGVGGRAGQNFLKSVGRTQGSLSCVHTTKRKSRPLRNCRDAFRRGMTKLSLRKIGLGLQGIVGRINARPRLRASENETSARPSDGSAASSNRQTLSWSRLFKSYSRDNPVAL
jgi:hypothetical protein